MQATRDPWLRCSHLFQPLKRPKVAPRPLSSPARKCLRYYGLRLLWRVWGRLAWDGSNPASAGGTAGRLPKAQQSQAITVVRYTKLVRLLGYSGALEEAPSGLSQPLLDSCAPHSGHKLRSRIRSKTAGEPQKPQPGGLIVPDAGAGSDLKYGIAGAQNNKHRKWWRSMLNPIWDQSETTGRWNPVLKSM